MSYSGTNLQDFLIPLEEIIRATNNLSPDNYISSGGFGAVYKGQLSERWQHRTVAIKRLNPAKQGVREFKNELKMISRCRNRNIVFFVGYCDEDGEMILVSEYAANGSLDDYLKDTNKRSTLTWVQRLKICVGAAQGLWYMHWGFWDLNRVIHRDMKSANILLDENLVAKICDFGLSRLGPKNQPHTEIYTSVAGTSYYCDPAYFESSVLTKESDVYSFGVILFEISSGKLAYTSWSNVDHKEQTLIPLVRKVRSDGLYKVIDGDIRDQVGISSLYTYKEIAYRCISHSPKERPTMDKVLEELKTALIFQVNGDRAIERNMNIQRSYGWEKLLPNNYKEIIERSSLPSDYKNEKEIFSLLSGGLFLDGGKKWFSQSKLNGKNCLIISAMELFHDNDENSIDWISYPTPRFPKVAQVGESTAIMHVNAPLLSSESTYAVFVIAKFIKFLKHDKHSKFYPLRSHFHLSYMNRKIKILAAEWRDEEWMEIELCQFTNYADFAKFDFQLLWEPRDYDLYVEGIEFRPIDMDTRKEQTDVEESSMSQEILLPTAKIITISTTNPHFSTKKTVSEVPSKKISDHEVPKDFEKWQKKGEANVIKDFKDMRFTETPQVTLYECGCKIHSYMLSNKTPYAAWLVFKGDLSKSIAVSYLTLGHQIEKSRRVYLANSSETRLPLNETEGVQVRDLSVSKTKLDRRPNDRGNGWFEVELFPFFNDMDVRNDVDVRLQIGYATYITIECIEFRPQGNDNLRPKFA